MTTAEADSQPDPQIDNEAQMGGQDFQPAARWAREAALDAEGRQAAGRPTAEKPDAR